MERKWFAQVPFLPSKINFLEETNIKRLGRLQLGSGLGSRRLCWIGCTGWIGFNKKPTDLHTMMNVEPQQCSLASLRKELLESESKESWM